MLVALDQFFSIIAGWLDQTVVLPILYHFGWMEWEELSFDWMLVCVYGMFAIILTYAICWPLEKFFPIERWDSHASVLTDVGYTFVSRVGVLPVVSFLVFYQVQVEVNGLLVAHGYIPPMLENWVPALLGHPVLTFFAYALILDCSDYWRHRLSHMFRGWYALHALHHAQRQMSFWSDDRNHLLDNLIGGVWFGVVGLLIGIPPLQFPMLVLMLQFIESLSHANTRLSFGWLGERLIISPRFHRMHHGVLAAGQRSCNFGAVFPYWDMIFGTANFAAEYPETGDPEAPEVLATGGFLAQQIGGVRYLINQYRRSAPEKVGS